LHQAIIIQLKKSKSMKTFLFLLLSISSLTAQLKSSINGKVTDGETKEVLIGANVSIYQGGTMLPQGASTDENGDYSIGPLDGGIYDMEFFYIGYPTVLVKGVKLLPSQSLILNQKIKPGNMDFDEVIICSWPLPLNKQIDTQTHSQNSKEPQLNLVHPTIRVPQIVDNQSTYSRSPYNEAYIDNICVGIHTDISILEIESTEIIFSGTPARFSNQEEMFENDHFPLGRSINRNCPYPLTIFPPMAFNRSSIF
jgi:CarboxypepD_reg-like domain